MRLARNTPDATVKAAMTTGRLTMFTDTIAKSVIADGDQALGVTVVDRNRRVEREVNGRVVVLCASAIESTRLLLNSATADHPDGLGNSSGVLGHYLMDHTSGIGFDGSLPQRSPDPDERASYGLPHAAPSATSPSTASTSSAAIGSSCRSTRPRRAR